jgi:hypothetical protein
VWALAVRAKSAANPTAVIALSWVARQVRRESRRRPSSRSAPGVRACLMGPSPSERALRADQEPLNGPLVRSPGNRDAGRGGRGRLVGELAGDSRPAALVLVGESRRQQRVLDRHQPTRFVHLFEFADEAAHQAHGSSDAVRRFQAGHGPELVDGPVVFTDYLLIATNRRPQEPAAGDRSCGPRRRRPFFDPPFTWIRQNPGSAVRIIRLSSAGCRIRRAPLPKVFVFRRVSVAVACSCLAVLAAGARVGGSTLRLGNR